MPWLEQAPLAGIHPLKLVPGTDDDALLAQRTRLLLRLPRERFDDAAGLAGRTLQLGGHAVTLGQPHARELLPHRTLYAYAVAAEVDDEMAFMQASEQRDGVPGGAITTDLRQAPAARLAPVAL